MTCKVAEERVPGDFLRVIKLLSISGLWTVGIAPA